MLNLLCGITNRSNGISAESKLFHRALIITIVGKLSIRQRFQIPQITARIIASDLRILDNREISEIISRFIGRFDFIKEHRRAFFQCDKLCFILFIHELISVQHRLCIYTRFFVKNVSRLFCHSKKNRFTVQIRIGKQCNFIL